MRVNFIFAVIFITILSVGCKSKQAADRSVILKGVLKGFDNAVALEDFSEFEYILPPSSERMIIPDKDGNFNIRLHISSPNYYRLGRNVLYLNPGDNMEVFINYENAKDAIFKGIGEQANTYLKDAPFPKMGSYLNGNYDNTGDIKNKTDSIEQSAKSRKRELIALVTVPDEFKRLETARIKADLINSLENISWPEKTAIRKITADKIFIQSKITALSNGFIDTSLMKLVVYRDIANRLIKNVNNITNPAVKSISDWYIVSDLVDSIRQISDKKHLSTFRHKIAKIGTLSYRNAAEKALSKLISFGKGDPAADFIAYDRDGKKVKLSDLNGKVIYVDIWATWCGPCMAEMPSFEQVKEIYKGNPDIAFVSLSIDNDSNTWKKAVTQHNFDGYQWRINRNNLQAYNVVDVPRMLLIDKKFKVANMSAPSPASKVLLDEINTQLK